ncbi:MAG: hypothetical protein QM486_07860 [Flavobacteriaceae bacterium]
MSEKKRKIRNIILIILISMIVQSCHPLFCNWSSGYKQLTELKDISSIIGKYTLSEKSKYFLKNKGYTKECVLNILESGNYQLTNLPQFILDDFGRENTKKINNYLSGKWYVDCGKSYDCLIELNKICVTALTKNKKGVISIPIEIGDGDECRGIVFELNK